MDHDLSLSQSFGGLRIANPDNASPGDSREVPTNTKKESAELYPTGTTDLTTLTPAPISRESRVSTDPQPQTRRHSIFNLLRRGEPSGDIPPPTRTPPPNPDSRPPRPRSGSSSSESFKSPKDPLARAAASKAYRQSMPLNHQAQQQAQFPPYQSNAMQNGSRGYPPPGGSSRPVSGVYAAQPPPNAIPTREPGSYRLRSESSRSSMIGGVPTRSDSRAAAAMAAGVPSRESKRAKQQRVRAWLRLDEQTTCLVCLPRSGTKVQKYGAVI